MPHNYLTSKQLGSRSFVRNKSMEEQVASQINTPSVQVESTPSVQVESKGKTLLYKLTEIRSNPKLKPCQMETRGRNQYTSNNPWTSPGVLTYVLSIQETNALLVMTT